jgi:hypothetical protein
MSRPVPFLVIVLVTLQSCGDREKIAQLEKQTQQLQDELKQRHQAEDLDLQSKCADGARKYFKENWSARDPDTILLTYENHFNKSKNRCFVFIEYHFNVNRTTGAWCNSMSLYDAFEGVKYGSIMLNYINIGQTYETRTTVSHCDVDDQKCTTVEEFNAKIRPYMND